MFGVRARARSCVSVRVFDRERACETHTEKLCRIFSPDIATVLTEVAAPAPNFGAENWGILNSGILNCIVKLDLAATLDSARFD